MRLMKDDCIRLEMQEGVITGRVCWVKSNTQIAFAATTAANTDARARDNSNPFNYIVKTASVLQKLKASATSDLPTTLTIQRS